MCNRSKFELDTIAVAEVMELLRIKVGSIVCNDAMRHTKTTSYSFEEFDSGFSCVIVDWYGLNPFGEFINCHQ